jgi:hypothetical protein
MKLLPALFATALVVIAAPFAAAQQGPQLVVEDPVEDLGIVESGSTVRHAFVLRNGGDRPLEIREVDPDCGCTVVDYDRAIAPGASGEVTAEVDLSTFVGPIAKYVRVFSNDAANPEVLLTIKVEVRPLVQIHPGYVRFLAVVGEEAPRADQTLWASDRDDFEVRKVRSPYPFVRATVRAAEDGERRSEGRGPQWTVEVELAPNAPVGPMADHLVVETNHPEKPTVRIPVSGFVRPVLAASPPFADFGEREVTTAIRASVKVENFSQDPIRLTSAASDLPEVAAQIQLDGDEYYVIVTLNPGLPKGDFAGTVTVATDSRRVPTLEIPVRGTVH